MDCCPIAAQNVVARGWQELSLHSPGESRFSVCYFSVLGNFMGFTAKKKKKSWGAVFSFVYSVVCLFSPSFRGESWLGETKPFLSPALIHYPVFVQKVAND